MSTIHRIVGDETGNPEDEATLCGGRDDYAVMNRTNLNGFVTCPDCLVKQLNQLFDRGPYAGAELKKAA